MHTEFEVVTLNSGIKSLRSLERGETFHPVTGPRVEAKILHVDQQRLIERSSGVKKFVIWDVGFGAAANALAVVEALQNSRTEIELHSFDRSIAAIEFALMHSQQLDYLDGYQNQLRGLLTERRIKMGSSFTWFFHEGNFCDQVTRKDLPAPHAMIYDPYSPVGNPEMWSLEHFENLRRCLDPEVPCMWTNYTRSTAVRVTLLMAGFCVGRGVEVGEKAETTVASQTLDLIQNPLRLDWVDKVRISTNAAPMRGKAYSTQRINDEDYERLRRSEQFR